MAGSASSRRMFEFRQQNEPLFAFALKMGGGRRTPNIRVARALPAPRATFYSLEHAKRPRRGLGWRRAARGRLASMPHRQLRLHLYQQTTITGPSAPIASLGRATTRKNEPESRARPPRRPHGPRALAPKDDQRTTHTTDITGPPSSCASRRAASRASRWPALAPP